MQQLSCRLYRDAGDNSIFKKPPTNNVHDITNDVNSEIDLYIFVIVMDMFAHQKRYRGRHGPYGYDDNIPCSAS